MERFEFAHAYVDDVLVVSPMVRWVRLLPERRWYLLIRQRRGLGRLGFEGICLVGAYICVIAVVAI